MSVVIAFLGWTMISIAVLAILLLAAIGGLFLWFFFVKSDGAALVKEAWAETHPGS